MKFIQDKDTTISIDVDKIQPFDIEDYFKHFLFALKTEDGEILTRPIVAQNQQEAIKKFYRKYPTCKILAITLIED